MDVKYKLIRPIQMQWITPFDIDYLVTGKITCISFEVVKEHSSSRKSREYSIKVNNRSSYDGKLPDSPRNEEEIIHMENAMEAYNYGLGYLQKNKCPENIIKQYAESWEILNGN